jgi:hypothetical protein
MDKIETGADKLLEIVNQDGKISLVNAVKRLGVSNDTIEKWAEVLSENDLVKMEYSLHETIICRKNKLLIKDNNHATLVKYLDSRLKSIFNQVQDTHARFRPVEKKMLGLTKKADKDIKRLTKHYKTIDREKHRKIKLKDDLTAIDQEIQLTFDKFTDILKMQLENYLILEKELFENYSHMLSKNIEGYGNLKKDKQHFGKQIRKINSRLLNAQIKSANIVKRMLPFFNTNYARRKVDLAERQSAITANVYKMDNEETEIMADLKSHLDELIKSRNKMLYVLNQINEGKNNIQKRSERLMTGTANQNISRDRIVVINNEIKEIEKDKELLINNINEFMAGGDINI